MARLSAQNMLLPSEISKCANPAAPQAPARISTIFNMWLNDIQYSF
jgi:hypothetical protein